MDRVVALFRGVNVGGGNPLPMRELSAAMKEAGFNAPQTLLQSGNVVFGSKNDDVAGRIQALVKERFDISPRVIVRSRDEWREIVSSNPMPEEAATNGSTFLVHVFDEPPQLPKIVAPDRAMVVGRQAYVWHPEGISGSKLFRDREWQKAIASGTARNWNTVLKLMSLLDLG